MSAPIQLEPLPPSAKTHSAPNLSALGLSGDYVAAPDGIDTNLLILFHGLGDTAAPFTALGKSLNLPQTAILSLRGMQQIPLLEEEALQWWASFDQLGNMIQDPNPIPTITRLHKLLLHLTAPTVSPPTASPTSDTLDGIGWDSRNIHLFGFAQGGTVAAELSLYYSRETGRTLGSLTTVSAPLLSHPIGAPVKAGSSVGSSTGKSLTPTMLMYRKGEERSMRAGSYSKGFDKVTEVLLSSAGSGGSMLRGRDEWESVMKFWATKIRQRSALEFSEDVYRIKK